MEEVPYSPAEASPSPSVVTSTASEDSSISEASPACTKLHSPIAKLIERTGYTIIEQNGQRRYGPPPSWEGSPPPKGCEVFVGKIPKDCFEDELVPVLERAGQIYELRLMMNRSGETRGFAYVVYSTPAEARESVKILNNYEIRKGHNRYLGACMSTDNCKLFVGGIPKKATKEEIKAEMQKVTEGVVDVIVYLAALDKSKNKGFAFVEYESHNSAAMARQKLMNSSMQLWGSNIVADWARPEPEEIMAQVKVLYVRNLMMHTTEALIKAAFAAHAAVERVNKIRDYAFVFFQTKEDARSTMEAMNGAFLDGAQIEVTLAKPNEATYVRSPRHRQPFSSVGFVQCDLYGTVLPVLTPPKFMMRNCVGACTMGRVKKTIGCGGELYPMTVPADPYFIYLNTPVQVPTFYSSPQMYYNASKRSMPEILENICQKHSFGRPLYTLLSTSSGDDPMYLYKVTLAVLGTSYIPEKLSYSSEVARCIAAEHTLIQLGFSLEGILDQQ